MYNYLKYLLSIIILYSFSYSQIIERMVEFKFGEHNALVIVLPDVDKKLVEDQWETTNKPLGKTDKKKGEYITTGVNLNGLSSPVDWYMKLDKSKGDIELALCVISGEEFLSSENQSDNFAIVSKFLNDFAYSVEVAKVREEFDSEKKELEKLQKSLEKTKKDIKDNNDDIEKYTKRIDKANKDIESNLKEQNDMNSAVSQQGIIVENLLVNGIVPSDDTPEYAEFEKENDNLQKLKKKLEKLSDDYNDLLKTIEKSTENVEKAQKNNKSDNKEAEKLKNKISKQGDLVESIRRKLESM